MIWVIHDEDLRVLYMKWVSHYVGKIYDIGE